MAFVKPTVQNNPIVAWSDFYGDRRAQVCAVHYYEFPSQAHFDDPSYRPGAPIARFVVTGATAAACLDPETDSLYTSLKDLLMRGLTGQLTEQEAADIEGLAGLAAIIEGATHSG